MSFLFKCAFGTAALPRKRPLGFESLPPHLKLTGVLLTAKQSRLAIEALDFSLSSCNGVLGSEIVSIAVFVPPFYLRICSFWLALFASLCISGVEVKPGKPYTHVYDEARGRLRITTVLFLVKSKMPLGCNWWIRAFLLTENSFFLFSVNTGDVGEWQGDGEERGAVQCWQEKPYFAL